MSKELSDIGLIGLAVMGQNLALNIAERLPHLGLQPYDGEDRGIR